MPIEFRLPNARAGEHYTGALIPLNSAHKKITYLDIKLPTTLNLRVDLSAGTLSGIPTAAGEFAVVLHYFDLREVPPREYTATLDLWVIENPKALWKHLPSDPNALFWRPDQATSHLKNRYFEILAASKRGRSHAHVGSFRDDSYQLALVDNWAIAVVADGAGSAKYSRRGAELIGQAATAYLIHALSGDLGQAIGNAATALHNARNSCTHDELLISTCNQTLHASLQAVLGQAAMCAFQAIQAEQLALTTESTTESTTAPTTAPTPETAQARVKDFSSTALITLCCQFTFGTLCAAYSVGDGALAIYRQNQSIQNQPSQNQPIVLLGGTDTGEFAGQTRFLDQHAITPEALAARIQFAVVDTMTALILMSDGVSDPVFETESNLASSAKWDGLWAELAPIVTQGAGAERSLLTWLDFWSHGNHDDRTLLLVLTAGAAGTAGSSI